MPELNQHTQFLINTLRDIFGTRIEYNDGNATMGTLDAELIERAIHNVDPTFMPSRVDSAVMPCPHNCAYCRDNDVRSDGQVRA